MTRSVGCVALAAALLLAGCEEAPARLEVWAAASLTDVLPRVASAWRQDGGAEVVLGFDASSRLARQIEAGAPADLFVSADERWMDHLTERGRIVGETRVDLLENRLVVVVPKDARAVPAGPADLREAAFARIALAAEDVPAGRYADAALDAEGLGQALRDRVVRASSVRAALAYVASGEADAGVVYRTDALAEPRVREAFAFPRASHPPIVYPAAVIRGSEHADAARDFLRYCRSARARRIFEDAGFEVR